MSTNFLYGDDIHTKMCKKIAQLTKVIYNLNSRAEEHQDMIDSLKKEHEKNINTIMKESQNKIQNFKKQCGESEKREKEFQDISSLLKDVEDENQKLKASLERQIETTRLNENSLCTDYENKLLDLQNKFLEKKREYDELHDSFVQFQEDLQKSKQGKITEITIQHHNELEKQKQKLEHDLVQSKGKQKDLQEEIEKWKIKFESEKDQFRNQEAKLKEEYELKTNKLKAFYEKELESFTLHHKNQGEKNLQKEKQSMTENFEFRKTEFCNRIRFLEKQNANLEEQIDENEKKYQELNSKHKLVIEKISSYQCDLAEKENCIENLQSSLKIIQGESKQLEENKKLIQKDILNKEELIDQLRTSLTVKSNEIKDLDQNNDSLKLQLSQLEKELSTLKRKYVKEKEAKVESIQSVEAEQRLCKEKEESIARLQNQIADLQEELVTQKETLTANHERVLNTEQRKHTKNIETFKKESERILKESQSLLLSEFHKNQEELTKKYTNELKIAEEKYFSMTSQLVQKSSEVQTLKKCVDEDEKKLSNFAVEMESFQKQIENLQMKLDRSTLKNNNYENILTELKADASDERKKLFNEQKKLEKQFEEELENERKRLSTEYETKIRDMKNDNSEKEEMLRKENKAALEKLTFQLQQEMNVLRNIKENEISLLMTEINELKGRIDLLEAGSSKQLMEHTENLEKLKADFEDEKKKLQKLHNSETSDLKKEFQTKMNEQEVAWHSHKKYELESLVENHEKVLMEVENSHRVSINALKDHLKSENEQETKRLQEDFDKEKESLHEFFRVENEERLKQLSSQFENQIHELKNDLHRDKELRLKEFSVHTTKIAELSKALEEQREQRLSAQKSLDVRENEIQTIRRELESKVEEILQIRRECNSRMRCREDELCTTYKEQVEELKAVHLEELHKTLSEWRKKVSQLDDEVSSLRIMLNESEDRFQQRPSRDQDIQLICELQEKILQQEILCQRLNEEKKHFKLELVNREENFNKVFSSNPNVGFMNPIEISRRKSSKKR